MPRKMNKVFTKDILNDLYIVQDLKLIDIAKIFKSKPQTVSKYLKLHNIDIKGIKHYNVKPEIKFNEKQYDFFDGLMLSDGSLYASNSYGRKRNAAISCAFKYEEFAKYIDSFLNLNGNIHKKVHKSDRYKAGYCVQYGLLSSNNVLFTKERQRWYVDNKKIIPNDFRFSSTSMNIAYLGDGFIHNGAAHLSLNNFSLQEIKKFSKQIENLELNFSIYNNGVLRISKKSTPQFLNFIGPCPVECYKYKWLA